mmetsp:Transcript_15635/g.23492  ORF Transcript_15635/g.23492 Transcript_15635/m.23492 type:complete len:214 (-) Transcript_15635:171-812(-)
MSCICFGGVCIPYSAILPFLLIVLQFLAKPLYNLGLLPDVIAVRLGLARKVAAGSDDDGKKQGESQSKSCAGSSCCAPATASASTRSKRSKSVSSDTTSNGKSGKEVITIESEEEYREILSNYDTVFVKFTAEWCKPCKVIHPFFATQLAEQYGDDGSTKKFTIIDVDELDDVAGECGVSVLPCFAALKDGKLCAKYTGSDEKKLEDFVKEWA